MKTNKFLETAEYSNNDAKYILKMSSLWTEISARDYESVEDMQKVINQLCNDKKVLWSDLAIYEHKLHTGELFRELTEFFQNRSA